MNKKVLIIIISLLLVIGCITTFFIINNNKIKIVNETNDKYVAYVKINPSVKLDYSRKCTEYSDKSIKCNEPIVDEYELINEDAKEIFNDVDLLKETKDLYKVIENIVNKVSEKGIEVKDIEIKSDWKEINTYLDEKKKEDSKEVKPNENNKTNNTNKEIKNEININVNVEKVDEIRNDINKKKEEEKIKIEEEKKKQEEEQKKKDEEEKKKKEEEEKRLASTIYLNDNVKYSETMLTYSCKNCFSTSLINTFKKAKGYYLVKGDSSEITFHKITKLNGKYNNKTYYGNDITNKILAAGGEKIGEAGSEGESLNSNICKKYNLICQ